ncbi:hypothetical protein N617_gp21 [Stygiolobus rod-shaped virus]|uniref:Uncharacterized protein n=1 Tax=Stygiolobus rod-shaped virus TaxID=537009 RepID=B6EFC7_9VIRU|nr:hypothetical protein N617_gp21 [Stygiolobus rod-shaped virus]CAQ58462.1 hypothetical protein [Stygiolobus rod-shaped virus]
MSKVDPFENVFGPVRLLVDKIKELESMGQIYGLSRYLSNSILIVKVQDFPMLCEAYIPGFSFYFQFILNKDSKTYQIYIEDFRIVYPTTPIEKSEPEQETEQQEEEKEVGPIHDGL